MNRAQQMVQWFNDKATKNELFALPTFVPTLPTLPRVGPFWL